MVSIATTLPPRPFIPSHLPTPPHLPTATSQFIHLYFSHPSAHLSPGPIFTTPASWQTRRSRRGSRTTNDTKKKRQYHKSPTSHADTLALARRRVQAPGLHPLHSSCRGYVIIHISLQPITSLLFISAWPSDHKVWYLMRLIELFMIFSIHVIFFLYYYKVRIFRSSNLVYYFKRF